VRLRVRERIAADVKDEKLLWQIVSAGFEHPRKNILNNLRETRTNSGLVEETRWREHCPMRSRHSAPLRKEAEIFALEEWELLVNKLPEIDFV
jgi:16S rRNA A1518/A1519 N6-dimethyltransferase RsmA/KsgA/DIM1 with predicted DNA glycosylase/AP lyase activity